MVYPSAPVGLRNLVGEVGTAAGCEDFHLGKDLPKGPLRAVLADQRGCDLTAHCRGVRGCPEAASDRQYL